MWRPPQKVRIAGYTWRNGSKLYRRACCFHFFISGLRTACNLQGCKMWSEVGVWITLRSSCKGLLLGFDPLLSQGFLQDKIRAFFPCDVTFKMWPCCMACAYRSLLCIPKNKLGICCDLKEAIQLLGQATCHLILISLFFVLCFTFIS